MPQPETASIALQAKARLPLLLLIRDRLGEQPTIITPSLLLGATGNRRVAIVKVGGLLAEIKLLLGLERAAHLEPTRLLERLRLLVF